MDLITLQTQIHNWLQGGPGRRVVTYIDRFLAIKLDSDPGLLNDIQIEACDGQGCVATGNKQRLG